MRLTHLAAVAAVLLASLPAPLEAQRSGDRARLILPMTLGVG